MIDDAGAACAEQVRLLLETRRYGDALRVGHEGLRGDPENARLCGLIAIAHLKLDDARSSREWAERALSHDPNLPWVHDIRARALLAGAGSPADAIQSALAAIRTDPTDPAYRYTLVRAQLAHRERAAARITATELRASAPDSPLGPIALALVELDRAPRITVRWGVPIVVLIVLTRGVALLGLAVVVLANNLRSARPLRRADTLLHEALQMQPDAPAVHVLLAAVLRRRYRFLRSLTHDLAAAAVDAGFIDADELTRRISKRCMVFGLLAALCWVAVVATVDRFVGSDALMAVLGVALFGCVAVGAVVFERGQLAALPRALQHDVRGRWYLSGAWAGVSVLLAVAGVAWFYGADRSSAGYQLAAACSAPLAVMMTLRALVGRHVGDTPRDRRGHVSNC